MSHNARAGSQNVLHKTVHTRMDEEEMTRMSGMHAPHCGSMYDTLRQHLQQHFVGLACTHAAETLHRRSTLGLDNK